MCLTCDQYRAALGLINARVCKRHSPCVLKPHASVVMQPFTNRTPECVEPIYVFQEYNIIALKDTFPENNENNDEIHITGFD